MVRPSASVRSTSRQRKAWSSTRVPGYHLKGMLTVSASWPRARSSATRASAISSAPPRTNGTCGLQTAILTRAAPVGATSGASWPLEPADALVEVVDQLQHRVVERTLVGHRRLDVPAHQPAKDELHGARLADERTLRRDGPEPFGLVAHREPHLGGRDTVVARPCGANLLLQAREQGGHVGPLLRHERSLGAARYDAVSAVSRAPSAGARDDREG